MENLKELGKSRESGGRKEVRIRDEISGFRVYFTVYTPENEIWESRELGFFTEKSEAKQFIRDY
jgi:predicted Rdx family selenoprotein